MWSVPNGTGTIYRRVLERDELADGVNVSAKTLFAAVPVSNPDSNHTGRSHGLGTQVQVSYEDGSGNLLRRDTHVYYGDPTSPLSVPADPTTYAPWSDGLEVASSVSDGATTLQSLQKVWQQRPCNQPGEVCTGFDPQSDNVRAHDPQLCQINTSLDSGQTSGVVTQFDIFNNQTALYEYDFGNAPSLNTGCASPPLSYLRLTETTYMGGGYISAALNLVSLPATRTVKDQAGLRWSEGWGYDDSARLFSAIDVVSHDDVNYGITNTVRGNVTSHSAPSGSSTPVEYFSYDTTGSMLSHTDFIGNGATFTYGESGDLAHVAPTTVVSALGATNGTTHYIYDQNTLQTAWITDENGSISAFTRTDPLDRLTKVTRAYGTALESWTQYSYPWATAVTTKQDQNTTGDAALHTDALYDGLGRQTGTKAWESTSSDIDTTATYDALGRVVATTNPSRPLDGLGYTTTYTYDALGRLKCTQTADGASACNSYTGNQTTFTDQAGKARTTVMDAAGRITSVVEDPGASPAKNYSTSYAYDGLDHVTTTTQAIQTRTFSYDLQGRLVSATNPENATICYGLVTSGSCGGDYDGNGNLLHRTDARGVVTGYIYDALNRITGVSYNGTLSVSYTYDSAANGKTRLASVSNPAAANVITGYDAAGRITGSKQTIASQDYPFSYTYNLADALTSTTYPSGRVVSSGYDGANRVNAVTGVLGSVTTPYVSGLTYAPHGGPSAYTYGNGVARAYMWNSRLQPVEMKDYTGAVNPLFDLQNSYGGTDNNGTPRLVGIAGQAGIMRSRTDMTG